MASRAPRHELIERLAQRLKCAVCGRRFRPADFEWVEERDPLTVLAVSCRECRRVRIVLVLVQRRGPRPGYTELEPDEWQRFSRLAPLTGDDVIAMHDALQTYAGDFSDVLEDPLPPEA